MIVLQSFGVCECARIPLLQLLVVAVLALLLAVGPILLLLLAVRVLLAFSLRAVFGALVSLRVAGFTAGFTEDFTEEVRAPFRGKGRWGRGASIGPQPASGFTAGFTVVRARSPLRN